MCGGVYLCVGVHSCAWVCIAVRGCGQGSTREKPTGKGRDERGRTSIAGPGPDPPAFWMWASSLVTAAEAESPHRFSEKTRKEYELPTMRSEMVQVVGW